MGRTRKQRRQAHGSAWRWEQTDCWYYTLPGTKKRMALFDENGQRIRGAENKEVAEMALARIKVANSSESAGGLVTCEPLVVAKVCSEYIEYCERGVANGSVSKGHRDNTVHFLNDLCKYCGALPVGELKKTHSKTWLESHTTWRSTATHHAVVAIVQAAFNQAAEMHGISNPLKGLKRPAPRLRLHSFSAEAEAELYGATEQGFRDFLFAALHTGLRPFCELARLTADDVEENPRGMMCPSMLSGYWTNGVGCSIETLAELMGDTPKVVFDHYGKEWGQHYQDPLWAAIGCSQQTRPAPAGQDATPAAEESRASGAPKQKTEKRRPVTAKRRGGTPRRCDSADTRFVGMATERRNVGRAERRGTGSRPTAGTSRRRAPQSALPWSTRMTSLR